jgi:hypothetical protein
VEINHFLTTGLPKMLYRIALSFGLLFLGVFLGREIAHTTPTRTRAKQTRFARPQRLTAATIGRIGKVSLH